MTGRKGGAEGPGCAEIDRRADDIVRISEHIMRHPESGFREVRDRPIRVRGARPDGARLPSGLALTGVKARMSGRAPGPTVGILGELDS